MLISHTSQVILKILQAKLQKCVNQELPDGQVGFRKGIVTRGTDLSSRSNGPFQFFCNFKSLYEYFTDVRINQFSTFAQLCPTVYDPMDCSKPGHPVHHQLLEPAQTHVHQVSDAIQPSHSLLSRSPALNLSQHQGLFKVHSSHQVAKVMEFQLQHQSFQ